LASCSESLSPSELGDPSALSTELEDLVIFPEGAGLVMTMFICNCNCFFLYGLVFDLLAVVLLLSYHSFVVVRGELFRDALKGLQTAMLI